jgi:hypothetical protein
MSRSFALEGSVTLLNLELSQGIWIRPLSEWARAAFAASPAKPAPVAAQGSVIFEYWCWDRRLLIEISDADYAAPKLAVID